MRIASMLASDTEMVCALGMGGQLAAISHVCDHPPEALHKLRISKPRFDITIWRERQRHGPRTRGYIPHFHQDPGGRDHGRK
jgi:hypothetical protein